MNGPRLQLEEIAESVGYGVTASACDEPVGPKFLRITDIQDGRVNWNEVPWCDRGAKSVEAARLRRGDIVFARTGATTGKSFLISDCPENAVFASYLIRVRLGEAADPGYVSHFFQTADYWAQITKNARGVAQPGVNATTLKSLQIPLPPLDEQKRIAGILDAADALRTKRRESLAQLDTLLQSTFLGMFGDPVTNPMGWEVASGVSISNRLTVGIVVKPASYYRDVGVPALRSLNIRANNIVTDPLVYVSPEDNENKLKKTRVWRDDVLLVRSGQPGTAAIVPSELDGANAIDILILTPDRKVIHPVYLCNYFNSAGGRRMALGAQRGQIQKHLNVGALKSALIPLPPVDLQRRFAAVVESVEQQKASQRAHLAELDTLFASLQSRAFRGDL